MLFIQHKHLDFFLDESARLLLLDDLEGRGLAPLIRSARRRFFHLLMTIGPAGPVGPSHEPPADAVERHVVAAWEADEGVAYTPGELFCREDHVLYLIFGDGEAGGIRAGIVYGRAAAAPLDKLERFCREVREALIKTAGGDDAADGVRVFPCWKEGSQPSSQGLARFVARQSPELMRVAKCKGAAAGNMRAAELVERASVRTFLRRVHEIREEGYSPRQFVKMLGTYDGVSAERLMEAGLLQREVRVSCRKTGHALFDLPAADSLTTITLSRAKCSHCAAPVVDEVIEDVINPTALAAALLEDGSWLTTRVYQLVSELGVPHADIAFGPPSAQGESHLVANVCGDSFLFVMRDADLTPALARRAMEAAAETGVTNVVVLVTGAAEDEGRLRLYEAAGRRARDGRELDITIIEGVEGAKREIERVFERAMRRALSRHLYALNAGLGVSAASFILSKFALAERQAAPREEASTPAVLPSVHGNLRPGARSEITAPLELYLH